MDHIPNLLSSYSRPFLDDSPIYSLIHLPRHPPFHFPTSSLSLADVAFHSYLGPLTHLCLPTYLRYLV